MLPDAPHHSDYPDQKRQQQTFSAMPLISKEFFPDSKLDRKTVFG